MPSSSRPQSWDIFCTVVDNYGDIGVCWRLARQLVAEHGVAVGGDGGAVTRDESVSDAGDSVGAAVAVLRQFVAFTWDDSNLPAGALLVMAVAAATHWMPDRLLATVRDGFVRLPALAQAAALFATALGLYSVASTDAVPFIYARF